MTWADEFQAKMQEAVTIGNLSIFKQLKNFAPKIDKKEVNVWKLPDEVGMAELRHWVDSVGVQLEAVHGFNLPDVVCNRVQ